MPADSFRDRMPPFRLLAVVGMLLLVNAALLAARPGPVATPEDSPALPVESPTFDDPGEIALHEHRARLRAERAGESAVVPTEEPPADPAPAPDDRIPLASALPHLGAYVGLSTWIDVYDIEWTPEEQVARAAAGGVQLLYLQSGKFDSPGDIHHPDRFGRTIELAHDAGMKVMVWYVPDFVDPQRDLRRAQVAINYTTPRGDRAESFGLDIETEYLADTEERTRRLLWMSRELREWTGPDYPLSAVVLPPLQLDLRPSWWPNFPYRQLRDYFDVFVPMSYSSFRGTDADTTYAWNVGNVREMRERAGDPELPVHLAGGIADALPEIEAFLAAARDSHVIGAGLYDLHTTQPEDWPQLRRLRADLP